MSGAPGPLAAVVRGGRVESVHEGYLLVLGPGGEVRGAVGDPDVVIWPRSAVKPLQAVAMLRAGLDVTADGLALACASHSGTADHVAVVRAVLASAGLAEAHLRNTPDLPLDAAAAFEWRAGGDGPASVTQNCSGKHAAMLATCVANGWDVETYLSPDHPLQVRVRAVIEELTGVPVADVTVDGCGAPLFATTVRGLARAFGRLAAAAAAATAATDPARAEAEARVGRAIRARPRLVGGPGRDVTAFLAAVPGLVAKDGAEGVYAAGLADGTGIALKIADGSARPRPAVLGAALELAWRLDPSTAPDAGHRAQARAAARVPVLGHGAPVGEVHVPLGADDGERLQVGRQW